MYAPETQNSNGRGSTAQMWITSESGEQDLDTKTRHCNVSQYDEKTNHAGQWYWMTRSNDNYRHIVSGITKSEEEAKAMAELHAAMSDSELIEAAAQKHLIELDHIGYQPRSSLDYSRGYDDGYKAAMEKLAEFLNLETKE